MQYAPRVSGTGSSTSGALHQTHYSSSPGTAPASSLGGAGPHGQYSSPGDGDAGFGSTEALAVDRMDGGSGGGGGGGGGVQQCDGSPAELAGGAPGEQQGGLSAQGSSEVQRGGRPRTEGGSQRKPRRPSQSSSSSHQHQHLRYQTLNKHPLMAAQGSQYTHRMGWESNFGGRANAWSPPKAVSLLSDGMPPPSSTAAAVANAMAEYKNLKGVERPQLGVASTTLIVR